jgi:thymidylate synthase (FAD)
VNDVDLVWVTPDAEGLLTYMARVSNPKAIAGESSPKLLKYLIDHKHWSPFEMVSMCVEINTTRDVARQIIRHRSFSFQEFSQRYAEADRFAIRECRMQDPVDRQNSLPSLNSDMDDMWHSMQNEVLAVAMRSYKDALNHGVAKEVARALLPEGMTQSKMYMTGSLRSWMHYIEIRCGKETQREHRDVANSIKGIMMKQFPNVMEYYELK